MKLLMVVTDPDRRGAQVFAHDLHRALAARGHTVSTVALGCGTGAGAELDVEVLGRGIRDQSALRTLRDRMAAVDLTVAHGSTTGPACAIAGGGRARPWVYRQVSDSKFWAPTRSRRARVRLGISRARLAVALSEYHRRQLVEWIGVPDDRVRVVPNGVPPKPFTRADAECRAAARAQLGLAERTTIAFVGALASEKGPDRVVELAASLGDEVQTVVAGDGAMRAELEASANVHAAGRVHFLGALDDVVPVYHAADVVVCPSRSDAMPAVPIEAGMCGVPVVATAVGAVPEIVVDGSTGIVVPADRRDAFAAAVRLLLDDEDRRGRLGEAARDHCISRYSIEHVATSYEAVLHEAIGR
jgi:glycosyltransferase involved in cell wall biosynthesis